MTWRRLRGGVVINSLDLNSHQNTHGGQGPVELLPKVCRLLSCRQHVECQWVIGIGGNRPGSPFHVYTPRQGELPTSAQREEICNMAKVDFFNVRCEDRDTLHEEGTQP